MTEDRSRAHEPTSEQKHQRSTGWALLIGLLVVAALMFGYPYLQR